MSFERDWKIHAPPGDDRRNDGRDRDGGDTAELAGFSLEDTLAQRRRGLRVAHASRQAGYDPYDTYPSTGSQKSFEQHSNLRELSRWIRMKRELERQKVDPAAADGTRKQRDED